MQQAQSLDQQTAQAAAAPVAECSRRASPTICRTLATFTNDFAFSIFLYSEPIHIYSLYIFFFVTFRSWLYMHERY